jgi:uncharacterized protein
MIPLRLVLDTNIIVSAVLKPAGLERTVLVVAITKPAHLYVSQAIVAEYGQVLDRPELQIRRGLRNQLMEVIRNRARLISPAKRFQITSDPNDNIFLECADAARADYLVTGNARHFPTFWKQTKVVTSGEFMGIVAPHLVG